MKRAKRTRRAKHTRARLEAEARRLIKDVDRLLGQVLAFERDHLDRAERDALARALASVNEAWRALETLESSLAKPPGRR